MTHTRERILHAALRVAASHGLHRMTRRRVAAAARVSTGLVSYHYAGMHGLIGETITLAARVGRWPVVVDGIAMRHPAALQLPEAVRQQALAGLLS